MTEIATDHGFSGNGCFAVAIVIASENCLGGTVSSSASKPTQTIERAWKFVKSA